MDEISNKTLATLLVVAIVISLAGTFFAMRGVSQVTNIITGAQVSTGTAKVNITETIDITLQNADVDFGNGYRNVTYIVDEYPCNLTTDDTSVPACWISESAYAPHDFWIENTGNVLVNVTISSVASADFFDTCDGSTLDGFGTAAYYFTGVSTTATEHADATAGCGDGTLTSSKTPFSGTDQLLCTNLSSSDDKDEFNISISLDVPSGPTGNCANDVTFTAARNY